MIGAISCVPACRQKSFIAPLTFLMDYPMIVSLKLANVLEGSDGNAQGLAQLINFAFVLGRLFFTEQPCCQPQA